MRIGDGSSGVFSSDLPDLGSLTRAAPVGTQPGQLASIDHRNGALTRCGHVAWNFKQPAGSVGQGLTEERKSGGEGKSVAVRVHFGCRRLIKQKTQQIIYNVL